MLTSYAQLTGLEVLKNASSTPFGPCNYNMFCLMAKLMCSDLFLLGFYKKSPWTSEKTRKTSKIQIWKWKPWALPPSSKRKWPPQYHTESPDSNSRITNYVSCNHHPKWWILCFGGLWLLLVIYQITVPCQLYGHLAKSRVSWGNIASSKTSPIPGSGAKMRVEDENEDDGGGGLFLKCPRKKLTSPSLWIELNQFLLLQKLQHP